MYVMSFMTYNDDTEFLGLKIIISFITVHLNLTLFSLRISVKVAIKQNFWVIVT